jgi:sec-independent protein translocase protein TatA
LTPIDPNGQDWTNVVSLPFAAGLERDQTVNLAVFQSIGPTELIIVLVIVLVIFGPKRLPGLGKSLGSGMKEFKDSVTGKMDRDLDEDDDDTRSQANAALGRADDAPPVDGEVVSERERTRG